MEKTGGRGELRVVSQARSFGLERGQVLEMGAGGSCTTT